MLVFYFLLMLSYAVLLRLLNSGWKRVTTQQAGRSGETYTHSVSVIIPVRNESPHISGLIEALQQQKFSSFEVIVVDDHSTDDTLNRLTSYPHQPLNIRVLQLENDYGKKAALEQGVYHANGELIITTDADCRMGPDWIESINLKFSDPKVHFTFGPVAVRQQGFWSTIEAIDLASLVSIGAATLGLGFPSMCNGANLAFRKPDFIKMGGYGENKKIPSGDDEFLLRAFFKKYPGGVRFLASDAALIQTYPHQSIHSFFNQRIRWAGKWKLHKTLTDRLLALFIFLFHLSVLLLYGLIILNLVAVMPAVLLLLFRAITDGLYMKPLVRFFKIKQYWIAFLLLEVVYPLYAVTFGILSLVRPFEWKGRKLKAVMEDGVNLQHYDRSVVKESI